MDTFPNGIAFISSAFRGDNVEKERQNLEIARAMCLLTMSYGYSPYASHLLCTQFLDDTIARHREFGVGAGHVFLLESADAVFIYEPHMYVSSGVRKDAELAAQRKHSAEGNEKLRGIKVVFVTPEELSPFLGQITPSRCFGQVRHIHTLRAKAQAWVTYLTEKYGKVAECGEKGYCPFNASIERALEVGEPLLLEAAVMAWAQNLRLVQKVNFLSEMYNPVAKELAATTTIFK